MQDQENEAKPQKKRYEDLKDIDISNLIIIQNPDDEIILGQE